MICGSLKSQAIFGLAAGDRFHGNGIESRTAETSREKCGDKSLSDIRVSPGDKEVHGKRGKGG
jgi:hypothetical protein